MLLHKSRAIAVAENIRCYGNTTMSRNITAVAAAAICMGCTAAVLLSKRKATASTKTVITTISKDCTAVDGTIILSSAGSIKAQQAYAAATVAAAAAVSTHCTC